MKGGSAMSLKWLVSTYPRTAATVFVLLLGLAVWVLW